ncbi:Verru_Chthon cassette protein D [Verrucomicrobium sp. GAS474]|uniref:Verru_Chthon cassette protein D n=1 Tax=Verrucomicrobium sp. GAS474 TaxID=1882831 RepID=UPI00087A84E3|nr:Verru_Chthon cassette protein D [Verrucomicrobium sp. GAS474]SDU06005.1 Verru_Chthon cassette protein D [Verrucomicrobium sp. GAS474]
MKAAHPYGRRAFSLIELLLALAIISVLISLPMIAVHSSARSVGLTAAGEMVADQFNQARQTAVARNRPVEVRIYKLPAYDAGRGEIEPRVFRALQAFVIDDSGDVPIAPPCYFSAPVVCSSQEEESGLLRLKEKDPPTGAPKLGNLGLHYRYISFQFRPNGYAATSDDEETLTIANSFVTLVLGGDRTLSGGGDYAMIHLDPITGRTRIYRP